MSTTIRSSLLCLALAGLGGCEAHVEIRGDTTHADTVRKVGEFTATDDTLRGITCYTTFRTGFSCAPWSKVPRPAGAP